MVNLIVGWGLMAGLYVVFVRGYSTDDPKRAAGFAMRKSLAGPYGFLPPSVDPVGRALWALTGVGFAAAIGFLFSGRFVGLANSVMIGSFLGTLWRENHWLKRQPGYDDAIAAARAQPEESYE